MTVREGTPTRALASVSQTRRPGWLLRFARLVGPPALLFVGVVGIWLALSYLVLSPQRRFLLPPPQQVVRVGLLDSANLTEILRGLWSTTQVAFTGLSLAIGIGVTFAIFMSQAQWIERSFYPYGVALQTIPILALVPLIGFWFGFNFQSRVIVCVLISIFPIISNTLFGIKSTDPELRALFKLHRAGRVKTLLKLELPGALPAMFAGFRISAGLSVIGAIVGDFFFRMGQPGIGRLIDVYRARLQGEKLLTAVFFSSMLGIVVFWVFSYLARFAVGTWHESGRSDRIADNGGLRQ